MDALFSVIIIHYNQKNYWQAAVDSVLMQDYPAIQLVFVDDGSKDIDPKAIVEYIHLHKKANIQEVILHLNGNNRKTCKNCNSGLKYCTGAYIAILAGDDAYYDKEVLSNFAESFNKLDKEELVVTSRMLMYDENLDQLLTNASGDKKAGKEKFKGDYLRPEDGVRYNRLSAREQYEMLFGNTVYGAAATAYRKEIFEICGIYDDENYSFCEDGYFFLHLTKMGYKFNFFDFISVKHRAGGIANPVEGKVSPNKLGLMRDYATLVERVLLPDLDTFSPTRQEEILSHYYFYVHQLQGNVLGYQPYTQEQMMQTAPKAMRQFLTSKRRKANHRLRVYTARFFSRAVLALLALLVSLALVRFSGIAPEPLPELFFVVCGALLGIFSLFAAANFLGDHLREANPLDIFCWIKTTIKQSPLWSAFLLSGVAGLGFLLTCSYINIVLPTAVYLYGVPAFLGMFGFGLALLLLRTVFLLWDHSRSIIARK